MTDYRFTVTSADPEVDVGPDVPEWHELPFFDALGSWHEWMNSKLSHAQRVALRLSLVRVESDE